jgi:hypothetical protein
MTPISHLIGANQPITSSASDTTPQASQQAQPQPSEQAQGQQTSPDLERLAAIRDELLRMRQQSPAMAPYIDQAIQSLVDGLSTTMQDPTQGGQAYQQATQGDSSAQPAGYSQLPM